MTGLHEPGFIQKRSTDTWRGAQFFPPKKHTQEEVVLPSALNIKMNAAVCPLYVL